MQPARQKRKLGVPPCPIRKEHEMRLAMNSGVAPTRRGSTIRGVVAAGTLVAMSLAMPRAARAGRLGAAIIARFPTEAGEFVYADLKEARALTWFPQLQVQMAPAR